MSAWLCRFDYLILVISAWHVGPRVAGLVYLICCGWAAMVTLGPSLWVIRYGLVNGDCWNRSRSVALDRFGLGSCGLVAVAVGLPFLIGCDRSDGAVFGRYGLVALGWLLWVGQWLLWVGRYGLVALGRLL